MSVTKPAGQEEARYRVIENVMYCLRQNRGSRSLSLTISYR
jgi:hypothetical protein